MTGSDETENRLNQMHLDSLESGRKRSRWQTAKRVIDAPFQIITYAGKLLVILIVLGGLGFGAYLYLSHGDRPVSQVTGDGHSGGSTQAPPPPPQPGQLDHVETASQVSTSEVKVGQQILNLHLAVTACLSSDPVLPLSAQQAASYCSDPAHLQSEVSCRTYCGDGGKTSVIGHTGFSWGSGPDQVQVQVGVAESTASVPHHVKFPDGHTQKIYSQRTITDFTADYTGQTDGGALELLAPGSNYITNQDGELVFWLETTPLPPCTVLGEGQECLVQQPEFSDGSSFPSSWSACFPSSGPTQPMCKPRPGSVG